MPTPTPSLPQEEKDKRRAEVRARLEAQTKKKKKGFMTPERKKRLRVSIKGQLNLRSRVTNTYATI